ncbi:MAG: methyltransferase domain-containing protein [Thiolinea sp.]
MKKDRIFDGLSQRFQRKIYSNDDPRGKIRLHIVQDDLQALLKPPSQYLLDAGGGLGQMSIWLAQQGHFIVLAEPSEDMLVEARRNIQASRQTDNIKVQKASIQELVTQPEHAFDGIVLHAVLEWLAAPRTTLQQLLTLLKPSGWISIMFFNQNSKEMRHLLGGDFKPVLEQRLASDGHNGLAPISPLLPDEVLGWLPTLGLELLDWSGVRCFYDYSHPEVRKRMALDEILLLERRYSRREPWRSLARYQHIVCRKTVVVPAGTDTA